MRRLVPSSSRKRSLLVHLLALFAATLVLPLPGSSQENGSSLLRLDARLGLAQHDGGAVADGVSAYQAEVALRTRGPLVVGLGLGVIHTENFNVQAIQPITQFEGQDVAISVSSSTFQGSPRLRGLVGYVFEVAPGLRIEPTAEGGFVRMAGDEAEWQPWAIGALSFRTASGMGFQFGMGRHRVEVRYHTLDSRTLVEEFYQWEEFTEFLFSVPLN